MSAGLRITPSGVGVAGWKSLCARARMLAVPWKTLSGVTMGFSQTVARTGVERLYPGRARAAD